MATVSTRGLADKVIAFEPRLPMWKLETPDAVPLGFANKIGLGLDPAGVAGIPEHTALVASALSPMVGLSIKPYGRRMIGA